MEFCMLFRSTRGDSDELRAAQAIIRGIAPDRGLYVPEEIPEMPFSLKDMEEASYQELAKKVIGAFFTDYTEEKLDSCVTGAYDEKFDTEEIAPLVKAGDAWFLELYHGKTAAFKDMALSILPRLLTAAVKKEHDDDKICILTATSGDTGKAALEGFADVPGTEITVFYPDSGVSEVQERQMVTQTGANTHVFAIRGNFDDAQTGVKNTFQDEAVAAELKKHGIRFSSANSINIGRLVPQVVYYIWAYLQMVRQGAIKNGDKINIVVPTGNFGNILAAYYAKQMGLPVSMLVCASNKNKVLTDFFRTGVYDMDREFYLTNSPSMDILISSNLERLLWHLSGGDSEDIKTLMADLDGARRYEVSDRIKAGLGQFYGGFADVEATNKTIGDMYRENGYLIDTHTAVGYKVYEDYRKETGDETPAVIASTASPYKFAASVARSIGLDEQPDGFAYIREVAEKTGVKVPEGLRDLDKKEIRHTGVIDTDEIKTTVLELFAK
ncbi:MAG: threonine synthase [Eubacterium sp.]|nr:threonine synthase [Eubacterium sp.]